ncbi:sperm-associated antigen 16 protein [Engraulis encrasicolus]|uniref:sperm-associated antigen 16 protein n=1 Tax=Engraulis encrasicolus TaxID=184585 RepID=UPI002FD25BEC
METKWKTPEESTDGPYYLEKVYIPEDSEDDYQYEEVMADDDFSLTEGDEDLEAAVNAVRDLATDTDTSKNVSSAKQPISHIPETIDDFFRNYLLKMGMTRTLDSFQIEWFEMQRKGLLKIGQVDFVPDAYTHNQLLVNELKNVQKERDSYKQAAMKAAETLVKLNKERDFHRMHHKRVVQEKNRLIEDIKGLKRHYASYEPALRQLTGKYQASLRQKMLVSLERDRAVGHLHNLESTLRNAHSSPTVRPTPKQGIDKPQVQPPGVQTGTLSDSNTCPPSPTAATDPSANTRHLKDSEFPASSRVNPYLPQIRALQAQSHKGTCFSLTASVRANNMPISCLALHPRKMIVAASGDDHRWRLWGLPAGEMIMTGEGHSDWLSSCAFHPNGGSLATTSGDTTVKIWDFAKGVCILTLEGHMHATWGCSFHSCGDFVASCSMDNTAKVWDLNSERCRYTLRGHVDSVNSVAFLPFANTLLTCSADKTLSLWDGRTGLCAQTFYGHQHSCNHAVFNSLGDTIGSCDSYGVVKLWDVRKVSAMLSVDTGPHPANQVAFSPCSRTLAVASNDSAVKTIEVASSQVTSLVGHEDAVQSVIFDHKGEILMSGGSDGAILVWS